MEKAQFCELLKSRQIPLYYYDVEDYEQDIKNLREWGRL
jgi:predicted HTH domain antitoxin